MKTLKFKHDFVKEILEGRKTSTWRLFDDKNLQNNDELQLIDAENGKKFAEVIITSNKEKTIKDLNEEELKNHSYNDTKDMMNSHKKYYGDKVSPDTIVKIIIFKLKK